MADRIYSDTNLSVNERVKLYRTWNFHVYINGRGWPLRYHSSGIYTVTVWLVSANTVEGLKKYEVATNV